MKKNLAVFISGQGSNLSVFLQNQHYMNDLLVVSDKKEAFGLEKAQRFSIPTWVIEKPINWSHVSQKLKDHKIDFIFLAGFMKIIPESFINEWQGQLFNLHPSLLPKYKGLNSIQKAFDTKDDIGVTIHHVTPDVDSGEILYQEVAVKKEEAQSKGLEQCEFLTHVCEQKLVKSWMEGWLK